MTAGKAWEPALGDWVVQVADLGGAWSPVTMVGQLVGKMGLSYAVHVDGLSNSFRVARGERPQATWLEGWESGPIVWRGASELRPATPDEIRRAQLDRLVSQGL